MLKVESYHSLRRDKQEKSEFDMFLAEWGGLKVYESLCRRVPGGFREYYLDTREKMWIRHILCNYIAGYSEKEWLIRIVIEIENGILSIIWIMF